MLETMTGNDYAITPAKPCGLAKRGRDGDARQQSRVAANIDV